jgi:hypothetical protein
MTRYDEGGLGCLAVIVVAFIGMVALFDYLESIGRYTDAEVAEINAEVTAYWVARDLQECQERWAMREVKVVYHANTVCMVRHGGIFVPESAVKINP